MEAITKVSWVFYIAAHYSIFWGKEAAALFPFPSPLLNFSFFCLFDLYSDDKRTSAWILKMLEIIFCHFIYLFNT